ncbi:MAG: VIT1/CCC1 transporter family protein [Actinomycetota bacterium]
MSRLSRLLTSRTQEIEPHEGPVGESDEPGVAAGGKSGTLRAAIFGINDGLVSNLSLIMGVSGAGVGRTAILVAGIAGLVAGAFSMGAGEYVSMRAQRELFERLIHIEAHELATQPEEERRELIALYRRKGMPRPVAEAMTDAVMRDPKVALETHAREELGLDPDELGSPWGAAFSSFATFSIGALVPLAPFLFASGTPATVTALALGGGALFGVGASMSLLTGRGAWFSGGRMLAIGSAATAVTYGVGRLLHVGGVT